jgi:hypothetical protein
VYHHHPRANQPNWYQQCGRLGAILSIGLLSRQLHLSAVGDFFVYKGSCPERSKVHDNEQLNLFGRNQIPPKRTIEYIPPETHMVDEYAYEVCQRLEGQSDPNYRNGQVVQGFTAFMRVITRMSAYELTRSNNHDEKAA